MIEEPVEVALRELASSRAALDSLEATLVARARASGSTWAELGDALGLSKQGARKRHLTIDPIYARRPLRPPTINEYHEEIAAAIRARRLSA